jgi:hypothetical protein
MSHDKEYEYFTTILPSISTLGWHRFQVKGDVQTIKGLRWIQGCGRAIQVAVHVSECRMMIFYYTQNELVIFFKVLATILFLFFNIKMNLLGSQLCCNGRSNIKRTINNQNKIITK